MTPTLRTEPSETARRQALHLREPQTRGLERGLARQSNWNFPAIARARSIDRRRPSNAKLTTEASFDLKIKPPYPTGANAPHDEKWHRLPACDHQLYSQSAPFTICSIVIRPIHNLLYWSSTPFTIRPVHRLEAYATFGPQPASEVRFRSVNDNAPIGPTPREAKKSTLSEHHCWQPRACLGPRHIGHRRVV